MAELLKWLALNVDIWRPVAISLLSLGVLGLLLLAFEEWAQR